LTRSNVTSHADVCVCVEMQNGTLLLILWWLCPFQGCKGNDPI